MLMPEGVLIDGMTGGLSSETGRYVKRLSELNWIFQDSNAVDQLVSEKSDPLVYEVVEYRKPGSDIFFGTTTMEPGDVAGEFFMTRGHFHERRDMGEAYYTQSGQGVLLLKSRDGQTETVDMRPGVCAFIPPDWAHRSINVGKERLAFVWVCSTAAGHDYGDILNEGMRMIVVRDKSRPAVKPNPRCSRRRESDD